MLMAIPQSGTNKKSHHLETGIVGTVTTLLLEESARLVEAPERAAESAVFSSSILEMLSKMSK